MHMQKIHHFLSKSDEYAFVVADDDTDAGNQCLAHDKGRVSR